MLRRGRRFLGAAIGSDRENDSDKRRHTADDGNPIPNTVSLRCGTAEEEISLVVARTVTVRLKIRTTTNVVGKQHRESLSSHCFTADDSRSSTPSSKHSLPPCFPPTKNSQHPPDLSPSSSPTPCQGPNLALAVTAVCRNAQALPLGGFMWLSLPYLDSARVGQVGSLLGGQVRPWAWALR